MVMEGLQEMDNYIRVLSTKGNFIAVILAVSEPAGIFGFRSNAVHLIIENSAKIISPVILREWSDRRTS
jgi:hypothetical protein